MTIAITIILILYIYACVVFYKDVHRQTKRIYKKTRRRMTRVVAIVVMVLFPSWDFLLGHALYFVICKMNVHFQIYSKPFISSIYIESDNGLFLNSESLREILSNKNIKFVEADVRETPRGIDIKHLGRYKFSLENGVLKFERIYQISSNYRLRLNWHKYRFLNVVRTRYTLYSFEDELRVAEASDAFIGMKIPAPLFNWVLDVDREMRDSYVRSCKKGYTNSMEMLFWLSKK